ncbi:ABC transporter permease [Niallia nealsonii]|uniref:ABC transporter permease n=1 Tax=Niallia nealsonii TaxID=115979 RepID=A0A2N0Z748_9BACI|nr:ABC transporter permease [Niallia nealsonii]PKG25339.1 ABC transporter permease [Niallia nealsonii]
MRRYLSKYLFQIIPVLFIISFIVFGLVYLAGDPVSLMLPDTATEEEVATLREALGLNQPFLMQYWIFLKNMMTGNFGESFRYNMDALDIVLDRLPASAQLGGLAMLIAIIIAIPLGVWSSTRKNSFVDLFITGTSVLGKAMPNFWQGLMLILLLAVVFPVFPVSGSGTFWHMILPALTLGGGTAAEMTRLIRSNMLEALNQDYVRTAIGKGLRNSVVIYRHAFKNCLIPIITIMTVQLPFLIGGSLITETVFAYPGIGQLLVQAVNSRDMSIVQAGVFIISILVIVMNMVGDILYRIVDPRIKYE